MSVIIIFVIKPIWLLAKFLQCFPYRNKQMEWTTAHNIMLCREVLVVDPFQAKKKTTHRAQLLQVIAENFKKMESPKFKPTLTKRSVQDRCSLLCEKHKRRMAHEKWATGISPEVTELDRLWKKLSRKKSWMRSSEKTKVQNFIKCIYLQTMHVLITFSCHFLNINKHYEWQLFKLQNKKP